MGTSFTCAPKGRRSSSAMPRGTFASADPARGRVSHRVARNRGFLQGRLASGSGRGSRAGRGRTEGSTPVLKPGPQTGARLSVKSADADAIAAAAVHVRLAKTKLPVVCTYQGAGSRRRDPWLSGYLEKGEHKTVYQQQATHEIALQPHVLTNYSSALKSLVFFPIQIHTGICGDTSADPADELGE
jgi:hypothetical protein